MARINSFLLPGGKTSLSLLQIARICAFPNGTGIFNLKGQMIGWISTSNEAIAIMIVEMLDRVVNSHGRVHPDWSMLTLADDATAVAA